MRRLLVLALMTMLGTMPAQAIDFSQPIAGPDGQAIKVDGGELTLGKVVATALFSNLPGDEKASGESKMARGLLAMKVRQGGDLQVSAEDIALMKKAVAQAYGPLIVARTWPLLDPAVTVEGDTGAKAGASGGEAAGGQ